MGLKTGIDIVEVSRIQKNIEEKAERFLNRVFTSSEIAYCEKKVTKYQSYAARFAAKEALFKALGNHRPPLNLTDIEVVSNDAGQPSYQLSSEHLKELHLSSEQISLSLSHEKEYAVAVAIIEG